MKKNNQLTSEEAVAETQPQNAETEVIAAAENEAENEAETEAETEAGTPPEENPEEAQTQEPDRTEAAEETSVADIEVRLAEAENRGYLRGRNERIAELMREPAMFERQNLPAGSRGCCSTFSPAADWQGDSSPMILSNPHISIWDR